MFQPMGTAVVVSAPPRQPRKDFNKKGQMVCGATQITMGFLAILFASAAIPLRAGGMLCVFGTGFYCSIFMFIAGGLGVRSSISENTCPIVGGLVMSVFSAFTGLVVSIISAVAASTDAHTRALTSHEKKVAGSAGSWISDDPEAAFAVDILAMLVGLTDICAAIAQIVISSKTTCCSTQPPQPQQPQIIFIQQPYPGAPDTAVPSISYVVQPAAVEAPPPYQPKP